MKRMKFRKVTLSSLKQQPEDEFTSVKEDTQPKNDVGTRARTVNETLKAMYHRRHEACIVDPEGERKVTPPPPLEPTSRFRNFSLLDHSLPSESMGHHSLDFVHAAMHHSAMPNS
jgi:hypothetical protein